MKVDGDKSSPSIWVERFEIIPKEDRTAYLFKMSNMYNEELLCGMSATVAERLRDELNEALSTSRLV